MNILIKILLILSLALTSSFMLVGPPHGAFGVKVSYQSTGAITSFIAYIDNGRAQTHLKYLSKNEFIKIASGHWPSIYNPTRKDYFEEKKLLCGMVKDSFTLKDYAYCIPIDSLWKIHFERHPIDITLGDGWSNKQFNPSLSQELFLYQNYGIKKIDGDYFKDSNVWKILSDVTDYKWIEHYKTLK